MSASGTAVKGKPNWKWTLIVTAVTAMVTAPIFVGVEAALHGCGRLIERGDKKPLVVLTADDGDHDDNARTTVITVFHPSDHVAPCVQCGKDAYYVKPEAIVLDADGRLKDLEGPLFCVGGGGNKGVLSVHREQRGNRRFRVTLSAGTGAPLDNRLFRESD